MKIKNIQVQKKKQKYLYDLIDNFPNIASGRKNYRAQYDRILKNILLSKIFTTIKIENFFIKKFAYIVKKNKILIKKKL